MLQTLPEGAYIKADHIGLKKISLYNLVDRLYKRGHRLIGIDELHSYPSWKEELKMIYDDFPDLGLVVSSSSSLLIWQGTASLSRRILPFHLPPLLFFEYYLLQGKKVPTFSLEEIIEDPVTKAAQLRNMLPSIYEDFHHYMRYVGLPFAFRAHQEEIQSLIKKVVVEDIPALSSLKSPSIPRLEALLLSLALSPPGEISYETLARDLQLSKSTISEYLYLLEKADIINPYSSKALPTTRKRKKVLFSHPMLRHVLVSPLGKDMIGAYREEIAVLHLSQQAQVFYLDNPKSPDFLVKKGKKSYIFEIGKHRHGKGSINVQDTERANFPLYLLGFLTPQ
ncbi:MAG: ATP-binding protein [Candidatus Micrarchaeota archaeon]|nr:ATP-binding protein [Candidatus Micrarchaeota archaeon]